MEDPALVFGCLVYGLSSALDESLEYGEPTKGERRRMVMDSLQGKQTVDELP